MSATITLLFDAGSRDAEPMPWRPDPEEQAQDHRFVAGARLLVVDDEPVVRSVVTRLLEGAGYTVLVALNGAEALELMRSDPIGFDLVITDIRMPGIDGWQLGRRIRDQKPGLPILYMSGYDQEYAEHGVHILRKPFDADELLRRVRELLAGD